MLKMHAMRGIMMVERDIHLTLKGNFALRKGGVW